MNSYFILFKIYSITYAPLTLYDKDKKVLYQLPENDLFPRLASLVPESLLNTEKDADFALVIELLHFGVVKLDEGRTLVLGPFSDIPCERNEAQRILAFLKDKDTPFLDVIDFFRDHGNYSLLQMLSMIDLLNNIYNGNEDSIIDAFRKPEKALEKPEYYPQKVSHNTEYYERVLFSYIEDGQPEMLTKFFASGIFEGNVGNVANEVFRKYKNLILSATVLASRAAVRGGLRYETAMHMADTYMQAIERSTDLMSLGNLNNLMMLKFAQMVKSVRMGSNNSKFIIEINNYIARNIYGDLKVDTIAKELNINRSYLSQRFKKETGTSLSQHISGIKIEEAKRLLKSKEYSILDVAVMLDYSSQSSFHRVFCSIMGMTPKQWQDKISDN